MERPDIAMAAMDRSYEGQEEDGEDRDRHADSEALKTVPFKKVGKEGQVQTRFIAQEKGFIHNITMSHMALSVNSYCITSHKVVKV